MRWSTHKSIGILTYTSYILATYKDKEISQSVYFLMFTVVPLFSSTLPDRLDKRFGLEHRGGSHSILCASIFSLLLLLLVMMTKFFIGSEISMPIHTISAGFFIGYFTHILADAFTDNGVKLFWPINKDKKRRPLYRLWYYNDGKSREAIITFLFYCATLILWVIYLYPYIYLLTSTM